MSEILDQILTEFLTARALTVKQGTYDRDARVIDEVRSALEQVEHAGGGVTSLATRQEGRSRSPWEGPLTDLDVDLMQAAVTSVFVSRRLGPPGAPLNKLTDVEVTLRQLGRWLCDRRALGLNALTLGLDLTRPPTPSTWAEAERPAELHSGRPVLRLVGSPEASVAS